MGFARRTLRSKEPVSELQALYSLNVFFDILRQTDIFLSKFCDNLAEKSYLCTVERKNDTMMETMQLRAELFRQMNPMLDSDVMLKKMIAYVKSLFAAQQAEQAAAQRARQAIEAMRLQSEQNGNDAMTLDDINDEIRQVRAARKAVV